MRFPGGKNGSGVYQTIINQMPPHSIYIEPFLGSGAIMRRKKPAACNIGVDLIDHTVRADIAEWAEGNADFAFYKQDGISFLKTYNYTGNELVYCDPPYQQSTRSTTKLYEFEFTEEQHRELLSVVTSLPCSVLISGYQNDLYQEKLKYWRSLSFDAMTSSGKMKTEWLWANFSEPTELHDYRYLGHTFRDRERIKRQQVRWLDRLQKLPGLERNAMLSHLGNTEMFRSSQDRPSDHQAR